MMEKEIASTTASEWKSKKRAVHFQFNEIFGRFVEKLAYKNNNKSIDSSVYAERGYFFH